MIIVAGEIHLKPGQRDAFLQAARAAIEMARAAEGCLDFAVSADTVEADRVNIFERWASVEALEAFRGSGMDDGQMAMIARGSVRRYRAEDAGAA
ncbi:MAG: antibiotic biosynthesis monooxygenase family protein [Caulobacter sp.]|nr:antibiotic biosynthesis monooxygenase family protein [Caulobacter sp.]